MIGVLLLVASTLACSFAQILELKPGRVHGFEYSTKGGEVAEVFLGIPYAAAPVGELRFEKPVPVVPWKGVRNGTHFGATCHPHARKSALSPDPSEDCLTLNVIRPKRTAPAGGYPILLWVHGGGYEIGSASLYGFKGFADIYIPHDIIVVTLQYRLGVYGFFSSGDSRMPGNLGLFDMAEAVKFVYENAENMGADPSRITAWGLSAGGAGVGQLLLSPVSRDYIARSIEMSGSPWVSWAMGPNVPKNSLELAEVLECTEDLKNCMKRKTVEEIYAATEKVISWLRKLWT
nr:Carboxylesterase domain containing protein [Haemonchus contortus]